MRQVNKIIADNIVNKVVNPITTDEHRYIGFDLNKKVYLILKNNLTLILILSADFVKVLKEN